MRDGCSGQAVAWSSTACKGSFANSKAGGVCISTKEVHRKKASRQMRLTVFANLRCCSWEQCAKVPPKISLMSVCEMSTVCSQRAAFFKGSGVEARLRRKLIACFVLVSHVS